MCRCYVLFQRKEQIQKTGQYAQSELDSHNTVKHKGTNTVQQHVEEFNYSKLARLPTTARSSRCHHHHHHQHIKSCLLMPVVTATWCLAT
jgi:hypothetical protein